MMRHTVVAAWLHTDGTPMRTEFCANTNDQSLASLKNTAIANTTAWFALNPLLCKEGSLEFLSRIEPFH
jgi:hypothetical protein